MAVYTKVPRSIPSHRRTTLITDIAAGDRIDVEEILGRPARGVKFSMTDASDTVSYRLNNLARLRRFNETGADTTETVWLTSDAYPVFTNTLALEHLTVDGLLISSFEVTALTLSSGVVITAVVW